MDTNEASPVAVNEVKTFLQAAKEALAGILNERKAILREEVLKSTVKGALEGLLPYWQDLSGDTFEASDYESILEAEKIFLSLTLIYKGFVGENEGQEDTSTELDFQVIEQLLLTFCQYLDDIHSHDQSDRIKSIKSSRRVKVQVLLLSLIIYGDNGAEMTSELCLRSLYSKEDFCTSLQRIVPKAYNYNVYMSFYHPVLQRFSSSIPDPKTKLTLKSVMDTIEKMFPESSLEPFVERNKIVMKRLGMESLNLGDCCSQIETSAYVLSSESPIEMAQKIHDLWLLLEASRFLAFDDNCMTIYVFSSELPVFHTQIMRIFFILYRIDESVRDIGYLSYLTDSFLNVYITVYTELHTWFTKLIRGLSKNYDIQELESDKVTGAIARKTELRPFIGAELRELSIYMTCPLATFDSIIRLSFERSDIPVLLDEEQERFIFTAPPSSLLSLHEFVASDREKFATHTVELYPCLDRHFQRFHKSKKSESQGLNTALPPSYHLFAKTIEPPEYQLFYSQPITSEQAVGPMTANDIEAQNVLDSIHKEADDSCMFYLCTFLPALIFFSILLFMLYWIFANI